MRRLTCLVGESRISRRRKGGAVEENRTPAERPAEELQKDDEPDFEGHALLERSPTESPTERPAERAPAERPMD